MSDVSFQPMDYFSPQYGSLPRSVSLAGHQGVPTSAGLQALAGVMPWHVAQLQSGAPGQSVGAPLLSDLYSAQPTDHNAFASLPMVSHGGLSWISGNYFRSPQMGRPGTWRP